MFIEGKQYLPYTLAPQPLSIFIQAHNTITISSAKKKTFFVETVYETEAL